MNLRATLERGCGRRPSRSASERSRALRLAGCAQPRSGSWKGWLVRTLVRTGIVAGTVAWLSWWALLPCAQAYTFLGKPPYVWPHGNVSMLLKLGAAKAPLADGNTSWDSIAGEALTDWNNYLAPVQFSASTKSPGVGVDGDRVNQVFFNSTVYGQFFGGGVVAVTTSWFIGTTTTEADVTFNSAVSWDSYRGPLRYPHGQFLCDFRRVALHEFGHVLGLGHPEQAGQTVSAAVSLVVVLTGLLTTTL